MRIRARQYREIQRTSPRTAADCTLSPPLATTGVTRSWVTPERSSGRCSQPLRPTAAEGARHRTQRRHPGLVSEVGLTETLLQVVLFESDADEDVRRRRDREQQVAAVHHRRGPEDDQETSHQRMPDVPVERPLHERHRPVLRPRAASHPCRRPNKSKWSIRYVEPMAIAKPAT